MNVLAVSVRYPTLFQTWFVNYIASIENGGSEVAVWSLFEGEQEYHHRIDSLRTQRIWTAKSTVLKDLWRAMGYFCCNAFKRSTYKYLALAFKYTTTIKEAFSALLLMPGLDERPRIIHCHSEKAAYRLLPLLVASNVPIVLTFHGLPPEGVPELSLSKRKLLYGTLQLVYVNTAFAERQCQDLLHRPVPCKTIPQGIDIEEFPYAPKAYSRTEPLIMLTVGRFDRLKGHEYGLLALKLILDHGHNVEYWLVGAGLYKDNLKERIKELGLSEHVKILGSKSGDELVSLYHQAHIFLLPSTDEPGSWAETQGIVIQEAQACGLVTIATKSGGIPECIIDGETGLLLEQKSPESIADAIQFLVDNPELWKNYQEAGRKHVVENFDYKLMGTRLLESYNEILSKRD